MELQWKRLLCGYLATTLLLISLFVFPFSKGWEAIDYFTFDLTTSILHLNTKIHTFFALANHSIADWVEDGVFLLLIVLAIGYTQKGKRLEKTAQMLVCILITVAVILLINNFLLRGQIAFRKASPSRIFPHLIDQSLLPKWISHKGGSGRSFPGDHATTALVFTWTYAYLNRGKLALFSLLYGAFLCLPRLMIGAHWLSDVVIGSSSIAIFTLTTLFCTPLFGRMTQGIMVIFSLFCSTAKFPLVIQRAPDDRRKDI